MNSNERMWRTLVRVTSIEQPLSPLNYPEGVYIVIPGWDYKREVFVFKQGIPPLIYKTMKPGRRYHVKCNIGTQHTLSLCFDGWEKK